MNDGGEPFMNSLISTDNTWLLWAVMIVGVGLCIYLEQTRKWAAKASGPVLALLGGMVLTNLKVTPIASVSYDFVDEYLVPVAIPLLLFRANIVRIIRETGSMFLAFHVAAVGTVVGAFVAAFLFRGSVERLPEVIGIMTGSYIGGGVNFVALKSSYDVSSELTNPLLVADNFIMAGMFALLFVAAGNRIVLKMYPHPHSGGADREESETLAAKHWRRKEIALLDIAKAFAVAFGIAAISMTSADAISERLSGRFLQAVLGNPFVWITFLTVALSTVCQRFMDEIQGAEELGVYLLYIFFFVIGLRADLWQVVLNVPILFAVCLTMAATNLAVTLGLGKVFRLNLEDLLLSVNAALGGAPSAAAMAISRGWSTLILPGLLVGIWGYVIGTFLGIVVTEVLLKLSE